MLFSGKAKDEFNVKSITSSQLEAFLNRCAQVYEGHPDWLDAGENIKTVNFAKSICEETARLVTLAIGITVDGSARAEWLQEQVDALYFNLTDWVEFACAYGTVALKPNGSSVTVVLPNRYMVTAQKNNKVTGIVFVDNAVSDDGKTFYTRLEYHRFLENGLYCITNKCYKGATENDISKPAAIEKTPWAHLQEEVFVEGLEKPLYSILRMPGSNTIDNDSPLGMPVFANALEELADLDIAYSRNAEEIYDSGRIVLMDSDKLLPMRGINTTNNADSQKRVRKVMELPKYVRNVTGNGSAEGEIYHEINPSLNTAMRREGINYYLSQIGYKCGFSNGYMVFDQHTGMATATQVESEDRRTIQRIKAIRDQLESALDDLLYAMDKFASLYDQAPLGEYEVTYDFGDLTYNVDEDRARWLTYVNQNLVPAWRYFVKFEGMSEEDAKAMVEEARPAEEGLFGAE